MKELPPFGDEAREFQVGFATKVGGRLYHSHKSSLGGFLDLHEYYQEWTPEFVIGHVEPYARDPTGLGDDSQMLRLFMFAGRRATRLAEVRFGLMSGWHNRSRVWSGEGLEPHGTLLSLGICEQAGVVCGEQSAFLEFLEAICGPAHIVHVPDHLVVPSACLLLEQIKRSAAQFEEDCGGYCSKLAWARKCAERRTIGCFLAVCWQVCSRRCSAMATIS